LLRQVAFFVPIRSYKSGFSIFKELL